MSNNTYSSNESLKKFQYHFQNKQILTKNLKNTTSFPQPTETTNTYTPQTYSDIIVAFPISHNIFEWNVNYTGTPWWMATRLEIIIPTLGEYKNVFFSAVYEEAVGWRGVGWSRLSPYCSGGNKWRERKNAFPVGRGRFPAFPRDEVENLNRTAFFHVRLCSRVYRCWLRWGLRSVFVGGEVRVVQLMGSIRNGFYCVFWMFGYVYDLLIRFRFFLIVYINVKRFF